MLEIAVDDGMAAKIRNGFRPSLGDLFKNREFDILSENIRLMNNSSLVAVLEVDRPQDPGDKWIKKLRVFN